MRANRATLSARSPASGLLHYKILLCIIFSIFCEPASSVGATAVVKIMVPIITIDGPSGSGKGTIGQLLAERLGWHFLDSGALYRVLGAAAQQRGIASDRITELVALARDMDLSFKQGRVWLDGRDVSDEIRTESSGNAASKVAAVPEVRRALLEWQRAYAREPGLIADGRDMGSVVFPQAQVKIFSSTSLIEYAVESTSRAAAGAIRGATLRVRSRWSRSSISEVRLARLTSIPFPFNWL